jgi:hypothetical protein
MVPRSLRMSSGSPRFGTRSFGRAISAAVASDCLALALGSSNRAYLCYVDHACAARGFIAPGRFFAMVCRQVAEQRPHVGERGESSGIQRPREGP